jgi:hypothetical protein
MSPKVPRTLTQAQSNKSAIPHPLRYYDPELQEAWNAEPFDSARVEKARQSARKLHKAYLKQIEALASRISKSAYLRFSDPRELLFDSDLLEFEFGDSLGASLKGLRRNSLKLSVRALFSSFDGKTLHELKYEQVASLNANIPTERWFDVGNGRVDSLLADELTDVNGSLMQHTFLFASGTLISVRFGAVSWKSSRVR